MSLKLTPAEQHIAEQSERRDLTSICQRLARVEDRMAAHDQSICVIDGRVDRAHKANEITMEHVESIKRSLEGAHESIERLMNRIAPDLLPKIPGSDWKILADEEATKTFTDDQMRRMARVGVFRITRTDRHLWVVDHSDGTCSRWGATMLAEDIVNDIEEIEREARRPGTVAPAPKAPFDFGAELRRSVDEADRDWDVLTGRRAPATVQFGRSIAFGEPAPAAVPLGMLGDGLYPGAPAEPQEAYNRRHSELLARAAADRARGQAYYELFDELHKNGGLLGEVPVKIFQLYMALGQPLRLGVDHAED